jgi:hypothetical protein
MLIKKIKIKAKVRCLIIKVIIFNVIKKISLTTIKFVIEIL